ncbi:MAG: amidoligase family protein [Bdellovibrionaceae bacterium]|nr:amidoligase family protein [Pseudobdellovibrionaceae bacterium]
MRFITFACVFVFTFALQAQSLLQDAREHYFDPTTAPRIGLEVELAGLTVQETVEVLQRVLGGKITAHLVNEHYIDPITREDVRYTITEKILVDSVIGNITVKPESNVISNTNLKDALAVTPLVEIVTAPMTVAGVPAFQDAIDAIKQRGAMGTSDGFAVAIQVNVEFGKGIKEQMSVDTLLNLLRSYLNPENHKNISEDLRVVQIRKKYLGQYSAGMMARILDTNYKPTWSEFHFDFMYRQSLELLGYGDASWTKTPRLVKKILKRELELKGFEAILRVVKWNNLRISSLFLFMFPNDWFSRYLMKTTWFHSYPIYEFREPNSDFKVLERVEQLIGFVQQSEKVGVISLPVDNKRLSTPRLGLGSAMSCKAIFSL